MNNTNKLTQLLIGVYLVEGREGVIELVEEARLSIDLYDSFFNDLDFILNSLNHCKIRT
jgi:hypothetical protein